MEIIKSVSEFIAYLESNSYLQGEFAFRGHSNTNYELSPSINRKNNLFNERNFIEIPQLQYPEIFKSSLSPINLLALLQHYGFPTRLFDVTTNPLVALYFSVCSERNKDNDGEIFIFHHSQCPFLSEELNALAQSYKFDFFGEIYSLTQFFEDFNIKEKLTKNMHSSNYNRIQNFIHSPFFVNASYLTARHRAQCGSYIFFPNDFEDESFLPTITPIPKEETGIIAKIIKVDKEAKVTIRDELNTLGFNRLTLFPEDFDGSCQKIKEDIEK